MLLPSNDHDIEQHSRLHYPTRSNGIIPTWLRGESKEATKYQREWVDSMTAEEHAKHLKNEAEYQKSINQNKHY